MKRIDMLKLFMSLKAKDPTRQYLNPVYIQDVGLSITDGRALYIIKSEQGISETLKKAVDSSSYKVNGHKYTYVDLSSDKKYFVPIDSLGQYPAYQRVIPQIDDDFKSYSLPFSVENNIIPEVEKYTRIDAEYLKFPVVMSLTMSVSSDKTKPVIFTFKGYEKIFGDYEALYIVQPLQIIAISEAFEIKNIDVSEFVK